MMSFLIFFLQYLGYAVGDFELKERWKSVFELKETWRNNYVLKERWKSDYELKEIIYFEN